jgi:hypothetical protein
LREFQGAHGRARRNANRTFKADLKARIFKAGVKARWFEVV